jgi:CheY-like chemotaxis protein
VDVQMAGMDGFTLAATIKADSAVAGTPLIMLASSGHTLRSAELKQRGIEVTELQATLERCRRRATV